MTCLTSRHALSEIAEQGCLVYVGPLLLVHPLETIFNREKRIVEVISKTSLTTTLFVYVKDKLTRQNEALVHWWLETNSILSPPLPSDEEMEEHGLITELPKFEINITDLEGNHERKP